MNMELILAVFGAVMSIISLCATLFLFFVSLLRDRKQATLEAYNRLQGEVLDQINNYTKKQMAEIAENPRSGEYKELSRLLARCQHFAVGVQQKIYDPKTVNLLANSYFPAVYDKLTPLIQKKRKISSKAELYVELEKLIQSMN